MFRYLDRFRSSVAVSQSGWVLNDLTSKVKTGEVKNIDEFKKALSDATADLISTTIKPLFFFSEESIGKIISSEKFSKYLENIGIDILTAITAVVQIEDVSEVHRLLTNVAVAAIDYILLKLEDEVDIAEYLHRQDLFSSGAKLNIKQQPVVSSIGDPKQTSLSNCVISGSSISLSSEETSITTTACSLLKNTDLSIGDETDILNLVDEDDSTFFNTKVVKSNTETASIEIFIQLNGIYQINKIIVEPIHPIHIDRVEYILFGNRRVAVEIYQTISSKTEFFFNKIICSSIVLSVSQSQYTEDFIPVETDDLQFTGNSVVDSKIQKYIPLSLPELKRKFIFPVGFKNILPMNSKFDLNGIFQGEKITIQNPKHIGLVSSGRLPVINTSGLIEYSTETGSMLSSVEYYINCRVYGDSLLGSYLLPILPLNQEEVVHEKLFFHKRVGISTLNNIATLRFFTSSDVVVYCNGTITENWEFATNDSDIWVTQPNYGFSMRTSIRIARENDVDIYTVSYTPSRSNVKTQPTLDCGLASFIDLTGNMFANFYSDNTIFFGKTLSSQIVKYVEIEPVIILRSNYDYLTPLVDDYMILS